MSTNLPTDPGPQGFPAQPAQHGGQQPWPGYGMPVQFGAPTKGSGLAITGLVLGVVALLLCWVPIVNNFAAVLALVGLGFGVPALISAKRGKRSGKGMAVAAVILSVLSLVGVIATQAFYVEVLDEVGESIEQAGQDFEDSAAGRGVEQDADEAAEVQSAETLTVGRSATVGDYTVTVTEVITDANAVIAATNEFNETPKNQYVLVNATVTYNGADEGTPWVDLSAGIAGSDGRQYEHGATSAVTPRSDEDMVTLTTGGTSDIDFVMDVPPAALTGGKFFVEETMSFDDTKVFWSVQ